MTMPGDDDDVDQDALAAEWAALAGDDDDYAQRVYDECAGGDRLCGACKTEAAERMETFLGEHQEKREEMVPVLEDLDVEVEPDRV